MKYTFCTLFDHNYLYKGLALHKSLTDHCPQFDLWILAMSDEAYIILKKLNLLNVKLIRLNEFEDPALLKIKSSRSPVEYMWTLTPSLPLYVFNKDPKINQVSYIDADCFFFSNPKPIYDELGEKSILLIEHRYSLDRKSWEKTSGRFNVELLVFRRDRNGLKALKWWRDRCIEWCFFRHEDGKLGDQMYLNDWPTRFSGVHILKHIGTGVAPWNIKNYQLNERDANVLIDGVPLVFYHFHAFRLFLSFQFELAQGYRFSRLQKKLVYSPYIKEIQSIIELVKKVDPSFGYGFSKRASLTTRTKSKFLVGLQIIRNKIVRKTNP